MSWILVSIVLSLVLTLLLNVGLRLFSGSADRRIASIAAEPEWAVADASRVNDRRVRVWVPWKGMIVASVVLTIVVNLVFWIS